jgi:uncharacterized membrane protein YbhN (UPF0104 family)
VAVESVEAFWDAVEAFLDALGSVAPLPLAMALLVLLASQVLRAAGWRNIIAAGLPAGTPVPFRPVLGGLLVGAGLNGIVPARGGDVLKLFLVRSRVAGTSYPMLAATLVTETLFNTFVALLLLIWAWQLGVLPSVPELPDIPAFELAWAAEHPDWTGIILILLVAALAAVAIVKQNRLRGFWREVAEGFAILLAPGDYLRQVVSFQAAAWVARVVSAYFFLDAFGLPASVRNALIVVMIQGIAAALPLTPGGVGPKQALLVVLFAGEAARSTVLAFSVGMEIATVLFQVVVGAIAAAIMLEGFHVRSAIAHARAARAQEEARVGEAPGG